MQNKIPVVGTVLAGGLATRMNGENKGLVLYKGKPLAKYSIDALNICQEIVINANKDMALYKQLFDLNVINDCMDGFCGPLVGMLSALRYAKESGVQWIITCPCDAPNISDSYVTAMWQKQLLDEKNNNSKLIYIAKDDYLQPVFALIHCSIIAKLNDYLIGNNRKVIDFFAQIGFSPVEFSDKTLFVNINNHEDLN